MPPKRKKGKKSGKRKKSGKKSAKGVIPPMTDIISELTKEFYLIQIRDLESRLVRYQRKCDELELLNEEFKENFDQHSTDKKEIVSFLKKQLEQRADEIADLQERLIGLQQAKDTEKDHYEVQLATLRTEMQEIKDQLTSENMVLGGKLASLEEFRVQKEELLAKFAKLQDQLVEQEDSHKEQIYNLEKKAVVDKDRLKKEMIVRVNTVASEFRKVSNKQMAETTKRTLRENVAINAQLSKMSDKTMELIQENDELREKEKEERLQTEILEHKEKELILKSASNLRVIRMLTEKAKKQEAILKDYRATEVEFGKLREEFNEVKGSLMLAERECQDEKDDKNKLQSKLDTQEQSYKQLLKEHQKLSTALSVCAQTIKASLEHQQNSSEGLAKREATLRRLVDILDLAAEEGCGISFDEVPGMADMKEAAMYGKKTMPKIAKSKPSNAAHYRLGDLGLVPPTMPGSHNRYSIESLLQKEKKPCYKGDLPTEKFNSKPPMSLPKIKTTAKLPAL